VATPSLINSLAIVHFGVRDFYLSRRIALAV